MANKIVGAFVFSFLALRVLAANVVWGSAFLVAEDGHWDDAMHDKLEGMGSPYLQMNLAFAEGSIILTAFPDSNLENANTFLLASKGDVVDAKYLNDHDRFFAFAEYGEWGDGQTRTDYSLIFNPGDNYYLAFREERYNSTTYGWVQLGCTHDSNLVILASAWDKDGDAILVGAIPEPSSALLLLLGCAGLALRRRRGLLKSHSSRLRFSILTLALIAGCLFHRPAIGAEVKWDVFTTADLSHWGTSGLWTIEYRMALIGFNGDGSVNLAEMFGRDPDWGSYWVYASYGDALAELSDYQRNPLAADYAFTGSERIGGNNLYDMFDADGRTYLAFLSYEARGEGERAYFYGWVELQGTTILSSAYSDMPLIVGTDQVIPEPSSALLLLLGCAGLALRRRRGLLKSHSSRSRFSIPTLALIVGCLFHRPAVGTTVEWNLFTTADLSHWGTSGLWTIQCRMAGIGFNGDGSINLAEMFGTDPDWGAYWVYASYGDALAELSDYQRNPLAADYAFTGSERIGGNNLYDMFDSDEKVYLAFLNYEARGGERAYFYGWVELQDRTILSSAYSDMPLIVGTGQIIPEPSSALLLLLGCAGLALRRRRFKSSMELTRTRDWRGEKESGMIAKFISRTRLVAIVLAAVLSAGDAHSASISWNAFYVSDLNEFSPGLWTIDSPLGSMAICGNGEIGYGIFSQGSWVSYWVYSTYGDALASFEDYAARPLAVDMAFTGEDCISGDNINTHWDSDGKLYLAIIGWEGQENPKYHYGWVELQGRTILSSAYSDMPLIVGTDLVIPEPSSALLLLLGCAGLALRRRRFKSSMELTRTRN